MRIWLELSALIGAVVLWGALGTALIMGSAELVGWPFGVVVFFAFELVSLRLLLKVAS